MGFRCLLGCDFGEPELKREREERGEEVIVTVKEEKTCSRCGKTKIVSENKEVTSIEQLAATAAGDAEATTQSSTAEATATQPADSSAAATDEPAVDDAPTAAAEADTSAAAEAGTSTAAEADTSAAAADDAATADTKPTASQSTASSESASRDTADEGVTVTHAETEPAADTDSEPADDTTDDGVILSEASESDTDDDRDAGEWPEYDEREEWPEQEGDDDGYDATAPTDDGPEEVTFGGGFTPEAAETDEESGEVVEAAEEGQFTKAEEATVYEPTVDDIETEFYCPECGFTRLSGRSSMRAGDICPECRKGYIAERQR